MSSLLSVFLAALMSIPSASSLYRDDFVKNYKALGVDHLSSAVQSQFKDLQSKSQSLTECQIACSILAIVLPDDHTAVGQADYSPLPYWSVQQSEVVPRCRVDVSSAKSISSVVKISRFTGCPFAVKSGGHAAFAGGSSINEGILINLGRLNSVKLSQDRKTAAVGPGQTWYDVYQRLDPLKVSVVGGREAGVGVGGLTLGGGISYFSGRYGWACDNVRNYEVVLANGNIVNASPTANSDLYWALRGGASTNFGIVSRFDLAAFEQGNLWGGGRFYPIATNVSLATAFANFNVAAPSDPYAHLYIAFVYAAQLGGFAAVSGPTYGKPVANAPIFKELDAIPSLVDGTSIANMSTLSVELNQTDYRRQVFKTVTFKNSADLISEAIKIFVEETNSILDVPGLLPAFAFQPLSTNIIQQMAKNGGNALGITAGDGPLMIMNLNFGWSSTSDDERVQKATSNLIKRTVALAKSKNLDNRFIYMNYASLDENVYRGYGDTNLKRLKKVKAKYDPTNVFGRLWPGYFKL